MNLVGRNTALLALGELFMPPGSWLQHSESETEDGEDVPPTHYAASCWCITGGIARVCGGRLASSQVTIRDAILRAVEKEFPGSRNADEGTEGDPLVAFNDAKGRTREDIMRVIAVAREMPL